MELIQLQEKFEAHQQPMRKFIGALEEATHKGIKKLAHALEQEVWQETNCMTCANCCKKMTPTLTKNDQKRIAEHLGISAHDFKNKYLEYDAADNDWSMRQQPCVFLDLQSNKCSIYEVRPADCVGFPHLTKAPLKSYLYIHKQNIEYCPASYRFIEKMMERVEITRD